MHRAADHVPIQVLRGDVLPKIYEEIMQVSDCDRELHGVVDGHAGVAGLQCSQKHVKLPRRCHQQGTGRQGRCDRLHTGVRPD